MDSTRVHRKQVKHFHEPGDLHELTFSCYHRMPLLTNDDWRQRLARSIDEANRQEMMQLSAFVFMPEHAHLLVFPTVAEPNIGRYLALIKQPVSKSVKEILLKTGAPLLDRLTVRERPGKISFRFWQEGPGYDRNLNTPESIQSSLDYIHSNPLKRGLCRKVVDWKWSSARWYLLNPPKQQDPDLPLIHGLPTGTFGR